MKLGKYSIGVGDRFTLQGKAHQKLFTQSYMLGENSQMEGTKYPVDYMVLVHP